MDTILTAVFWIACFLAIYAYAIFPVGLALVARSRPSCHDAPPMPVDSKLPRVAMVVAAYNEAGCIRAKLENTRRLDYPPDQFELYIGSDGSTDGTADLLDEARDAGFNVYRFERRRGKISVINDLVSHVDADILVMSDANTMFEPGALKQLARHFVDPSIGCVSGQMCLEQEGGVSGEGMYWKFENWIKKNESRLGFLIGCNGGIFALRRALYADLPASTIVDDFVLSLHVLELGYKVIIEPLARGFEPACPTARVEMARKARIGAGNWQALGMTFQLLRPRYGLIATAYWGHKILRWATPLFILVILGTSCLLSSSPFYRGVFVANVIGATLAFIASYAPVGARLPRFTRPVTYFYLMNYALLRGLLRFIFHTQKVTWDRRPATVLAPGAQRRPSIGRHGGFGHA